MNGKILVVGGYGNVGRTISLSLGDRFPGRVIAAGRNYAKAQELAQASGMRVHPFEMDVYSLCEDINLPCDTRLIIMCMDLPNADFVQNCLQQGISYIDISASHQLLSKIELLDCKAKQQNATGVLSVGLAPGLTNLLVSHCKSKLEDMWEADIFVLLGLGESHGEAAIRWTIENLDANFSVCEKGIAKQSASFREAKRTVFPENIGTRTAYRFNFSEQQVLPRTLKIPTVSTWICLDSALVTHLLAFLKKSGILGMLRFRRIRELLLKLFKMFQFGSDIFSIKIDAYGTINGRNALYQCSAHGYGEGHATAYFTSEVAASLSTSAFPPGVFHVEQLFSPEEMISKLKDKGIGFDFSGPAILGS